MANRFTSFISSTQQRIFPDVESPMALESASCFSGEPFSFFLSYKFTPEGTEKPWLPISVRVDSEDLEATVYRVDYLPVTHAHGGGAPRGWESRGAGLYPDVLYRRSAKPRIEKEAVGPYTAFFEQDERNLLNATDTVQSILVTLNERGDSVRAGTRSVTVTVTSLNSGEQLAEHTLSLRVIGAELPESRLMYTNWIHYDCIAENHGVELYSEDYFSLLRGYLSNAALHGMNTLLLPAFTPAFDTLVGRERTCVQLTRIERTCDGYAFDFSLLDRFTELAFSCGIRYLEHAPLFSQWGARHAPNIYAWQDGALSRIFGWETDATGEEYIKFLRAYLDAFLANAEARGYADAMIFHISDEPNAECEQSYAAAYGAVKESLAGRKCGDALSDYLYYQKGLVQTPIVGIAKADDFFERCPHFWLYYTGGYRDGATVERCSNRLLDSKPYLTRILGLHLYKYKAEGFLHWGYNFNYDRMSAGHFDPRANPCGYKQMPGASFLVYYDRDGVLPSLREKSMCEAINDHRALCLLEQFIGYDGVIRLCEEFFGERITCTTVPESAKQMLEFRAMIEREIEKYV